MGKGQSYVLHSLGLETRILESHRAPSYVLRFHDQFVQRYRIPSGSLMTVQAQSPAPLLNGHTTFLETTGQRLGATHKHAADGRLPEGFDEPRL